MGGLSRSRAAGIVFAVVLCSSGCASGGSGGGARRHFRNVIMFEELNDLDAVDSYEAIQRLRPSWLRTRTGRGMPRVVLNGVPLGGDVHTLRGMLIRGVEEIRFLSALEATTRFGTGYVNGAILVTTGVR